MVKFNKNGAIKAKDYLSNYIVKDGKRRPIIIIIYNKCRFFANDGVWKVWTQKGDIFLWLKSQDQGIMTSDFLLFFGQLNLAFLFSKKRKNVVTKNNLLKTEAIEIFKYRKNNDKYWNRAKLHKQVINKALPIVETLYLGNSLLFLLNNATNHWIYTKDVF